MLRATTPPSVRTAMAIAMAPTPAVVEMQEKEATDYSDTSDFTPPEYTMKQIHDAIPVHCFKPNTLLSLFYILRDFFFVLVLGFLASTQIPKLESPMFRNLAWAAYAFTQGLVFTGLWELAHECGHGALSKKRWFNHAAGMVMHSFLFVPYHSWRFTHSHHHKSTNNLERDIAFVPDLKEDYEAKRDARGSLEWGDLIEDMPIVTLTWLFFHQLIAFPLYLTINNFALSWIRVAPWWKRSHFYFGPGGPLFKDANKKEIVISDLGIATAAFGLWVAVHYFGAKNVMLLYGFPYLWTNHWILTITYLQHTSSALPYYSNPSWTFLRGAASTIDRDFGFIGRHLFHGAIETHVLHHHASRIPFYHAAEASAAMRQVMGTHYQSNFQSSYLLAFWRNLRNCRYVVEQKEGNGIWFFDAVKEL